mmetsp:Transcript_13529/g.19800  ORF Transcript_13529/g.19800 Transcript_13529/m.19800 type:complete len:407 (-) Transcript_13529:215-1435(-)
MTHHSRTSNWRVIESFTCGKSDSCNEYSPSSNDAPSPSIFHSNNRSIRNEDAIVITPHFAVVLDGVTDKSSASSHNSSLSSASQSSSCDTSCDLQNKNNAANNTADTSQHREKKKEKSKQSSNEQGNEGKESPGRFASRILSEAFCDASIVQPNMTFREVLDVLTDVLDDGIRRKQQQNNDDSIPFLKLQSKRPAVGAVVAYSASRRELWRLGDGSYRIDDTHLSLGHKAIDELTAHVRSVRLEMALLSGEFSLTDENDLETTHPKKDIGRDCILPLLQNQHVFCNVAVEESDDDNEEEEIGEKALKRKYGYGCLNGTYIPDQYLEIIPIPLNAREIVMASDGYPCVENTLEKSEKVLQQLLKEDPLCFRTNKSTKGIMNGNSSFDDRSYLRIALNIDNTKNSCQT